MVENLTKKYGNKIVIDSLSFTVTPGRVTGFLGPNGSGKSITMRCMLGLDHADAGKALFDGIPFRNIRTPLFKVGALLDAGDAHTGRTAKNHLKWMALSNGISMSQVDHVLARVGLTEVAHQRVGKFSLGMRQRLGLAAALLGDPQIVMLDEPANGLDPEGIRWTRDLLKSLAHEGRAVFVSSHQLSEMSLMADDLIVIGKGKLISQGPVTDFISQNAQEWVNVSSPQLRALVDLISLQKVDVKISDDVARVSGMNAQTIGELAFANNIVLHELSTQTGSLEDAFLGATDSSVEYRGEVPSK